MSQMSAVQKAEYDSYMLSYEWQMRRQFVFERDKYRCRYCGKPATQIHHTTYDNFKHELPEELESVCADCHPKADEQRRAEVAAQAWWRRVDGWASKKYGENWEQ